MISRPLLTHLEVQALLGLSPTCVLYHTRMGHLRHLMVPTCRRMAWLAEGLVPDAPALPQRSMLGVPEVAALLTLSPSCTYRLAGQGVVPMSKRLGSWSIHAQQLRAWVGRHLDGVHSSQMRTLARGGAEIVEVDCCDGCGRTTHRSDLFPVQTAAITGRQLCRACLRGRQLVVGR